MAYDDWDDETKNAPLLLPTQADRGKEKAYLIVLTGLRLGTMVEVRDGFTIGRSDRCDLQIPENGISRNHAAFRARSDGMLIIEDLDSRNGTYVNGEQVESTVLADGDKIQIGSTTILKFSYADRLEENFELQLREAAIRDPLTRTFNRRSLDDHLAREASFARRHQSPLSVILFDIDHFKAVNDTHGHQIGDELLRELASVMQRQIRKEDFLARYGGEEFLMVCAGITGPEAYRAADRLRLSVASVPLVQVLPDLRVTISGGVAAMPSAQIDGERDLVDAADKALYDAKSSGRNRIVLFGS